MRDADGLRLRAMRYLAMAFKAREDGEADFATRLTERATGTTGGSGHLGGLCHS
jgi:hypothetical protein